MLGAPGEPERMREGRAWYGERCVRRYDHYFKIIIDKLQSCVFLRGCGCLICIDMAQTP